MKTASMVLFCLTLTTVPVSAAPSGADLLGACETAMQNDFAGMEGQMCEYYVRPCDCDFGKVSKTPRVCLPESVDVKMLARKVITGLEVEPALQKYEASRAAAVILARDYPCQY